MKYTRDRAVSPVVAVILLVAVTVTLSAVIGGFALNLGQSATGSTQSDIGTSIDQKPSGNVSVTVVTGSADSLKVLVNGSEAASITNPSPGDSASVVANDSADVTVVSVTDGEKSVVTSTTVDSTGSTTVAESSSKPFASDSLVALWSYDDDTTSSTLVDEWGNHNGTIYSAPSYVSGHDNLSLQFDGTDDYVNASVPMNQSFTYAVWAKSATSSWSAHGVIGSAREANGFIMHPEDTGTTWKTFVINNTDNGYTEIGQHTPSDITVWHQYVLSYDHSTGEAVMYFDGTRVNSSTISITRSSGTIPLYLGKDDGNPRYLDGQLDDTRLYNRSLNDSEVQTLYNETK